LAPFRRRLENEFPLIHIRRKSLACGHGYHPKASGFSIRNRLHDHGDYASFSTILILKNSIPQFFKKTEKEENHDIKLFSSLSFHKVSAHDISERTMFLITAIEDYS
jgi:hypothetical protein